jgi:hypothetical protein
MKTLIILAVITGLLLWYALWGRDWLKSKPWAQGFFAWVEPVEIVIFKKSRTILLARILKALGIVLAALQYFDGVDLAPILPLVPEKYQWFLTTAVGSIPLLSTIVGWMVERLRNETSTPIQLVALPDKVVAESPKLQDVIAKADDAKVEAVAVTAVAVAEAKVA